MAIDLDALATFVKVAQLASFTRAAERLGVAKAKVSLQIGQLEAALGAKVLQRSTRVVRLTAEGEQLLGRAHRLLADAEDVGTMFQSGKSVRGRVRVDLPVGIARQVVIPNLPKLFARHPGIQVELSVTDRRVDAMREGIDCVVRVGARGDANLVGRRLGSLRMMNCASPGYLRAHGVPRGLDDLARHLVVHYSSTLGEQSPSFEYPTQDGYAELSMRSVLTVNSVEAYHAAAVAGLGLIQVPRAGMHGKLAAGALVEVLPELCCAPMPVWLLHTHGRGVPRCVRAVMKWVAEVIAPFIEADSVDSVDKKAALGAAD